MRSKFFFKKIQRRGDLRGIKNEMIPHILCILTNYLVFLDFDFF